jgi:5-methylcytosine-specific restriction endonuclease McrA
MSNASKKCSKCGQIKSLEDFSRDRSAKDGLQSACKGCRRLVVEEWRRKNPDKVRAYSKMYQRENADQRREYRREWRRRNPEASRKQKREWRQKNIERALEQERQRLRRWRKLNYEKDREAQRQREAAFRSANPERAREKSRQSKQRWRARKRDGIGYRVATKDIRRLSLANCVACGLPADSLDHVIPLSRGGSHGIGNLAPMCRGCNSSKGAKTVTEWRKVNDWLPLGSFPQRKDRADGAA